MTLDEFKLANVVLGEQLGICPEDVLGALALLLDSERRNPTTPANCIVFARQGVDGAHYALLKIDDRPLHEQPVILIAPMGPDYSCLGETLEEFVELQAQWAEELADEIQEMEGDPGWASEKRGIVQAIREHFGLRPRPDYQQRWEALDREYLPRLDIAPDILESMDEDNELFKFRPHPPGIQ
jgi:hypothetical protein